MILRFVNYNIEECLDYAELFELNSSNFSLLNFIDRVDISNDINLGLNQVECNN